MGIRNYDESNEINLFRCAASSQKKIPRSHRIDNTHTVEKQARYLTILKDKKLQILVQCINISF